MNGPDVPTPLRLAAAASPAARARARQIAATITALNPGTEVALVEVETPAVALEQVRAGAVEAAVTGADELPVSDPGPVVLAAVPHRLDPRDALISREGWHLATLPRTRPVTVAVSGVVRRAQLQRQRRDLLLQAEPSLLDDRLAAVEGGDLDAIVVPLADLLLARPASTALVVVPLEHGEVLHAPGQGVTAVTCLRSAATIRKLLARIDDAACRAELEAERELWRQLSQDDDPPVGAHAEMRISVTGQSRLVLLGLLTDASGSRRARASHETAPEEAVTLGRAMAATLLEATTPSATGTHRH